MKIESVADQRLVARAIKEGWPITQQMRESLVTQTYERSQCGVPEVEHAATMAMMAMDKRNQELRQEEQKKQEAEHARKLQLIELAVKLGIAGNERQGTGGEDSLTPARIDARSPEGTSPG